MDFQPEKQEIPQSSGPSLLGNMVSTSKNGPDNSFTSPLSNANIHQLDKKRSLFKRRIRGIEKPTGNVAELTIDVQSIKQPSRPYQPKADFESISKKLTKYLLHVYLQCNPSYSYQPMFNPRRALTKPSHPAHNNGVDNENWDFILYVNDVIGTQEGHQYHILDLLGQGTFGQVVKCQNIKTKELIALKIVKNKPAYYNQSLMEVAILDLLNNKHDPDNKHQIVRMKEHFVFKNHLCIGFEMLSVNLYELIKQNQFRGLSTNLVRIFVSQILDSLSLLHKNRIIHCDLKPENILLKSLETPTVKIIDFGSACHENQTVYTYIQSRFYRSPEVLLGLPYSSSIDMWSLGCIASEIFLGLPLFPGTSEYNQVSRIVEILGVPPSYMCSKGKGSAQYFMKISGDDEKPVYVLKTMEQYMQPSKRYFKGTTLSEIINSYPIMRKNMSPRQMEKEMEQRRSFIDFLTGVLNLNPLQRWSPDQARRHPFITGEPFTGSYIPQTIPASGQMPAVKTPEIRDIRAAKQRSSLTSNSMVGGLSGKTPASPQEQRRSLNMPYSPADIAQYSFPKKPSLGISIPENRTTDQGRPSAMSIDMSRVAGSFAEFQLRNNPAMNATPPQSASVINYSPFDYNFPNRRASISYGAKNSPFQTLPGRKQLDGQDPYAGSYEEMAPGTEEYFAEHPRYGDYGERQRLPSRMPSVAASVDWEPFQEDYYGRSSRQSSFSDMNWQGPSSPRSLYQHRSSHNRSLSHTSIGSFDEFLSSSRRSSQSHHSPVDHHRHTLHQDTGRASLSRLNTYDNMQVDHEMHSPGGTNYNNVMSGSPSRTSFPISPRSSQANLFSYNNQAAYFKHPHKRVSLASGKSYEDDDSAGYRRTSNLSNSMMYNDPQPPTEPQQAPDITVATPSGKKYPQPASASHSRSSLSNQLASSQPSPSNQSESNLAPADSQDPSRSTSF